jgi:putative cardiolipin synthase
MQINIRDRNMHKNFFELVSRVFLASLLLLFISGCTTINKNARGVVSHAEPPAQQGLLADTASSLALAEDQTAALPLYAPDEALKWRLALVDQATSSIDIQYFIWSGDAAGLILFKRLVEAADRGVRVRILVDDLGLNGTDKNLASWSLHPNLEIRLWNPSKMRKSALGAIGEFMLFFRELNRRMHNKLFVVDNRFAMLGGRNIGNPYFGLSDKYNNIDFDLLLAGAVVPEISSAFDQYWNADQAFPGIALSERGSQQRQDQLRRELEQMVADNASRLAAYPLQRQSWQQRFAGLPEKMEIGRGHFLQDVPLSMDGRELKLIDMLDQVSGITERELIVVSPYFIPDQDMLDSIADLTNRGVRVRILTGSLGSNNHTAVHSHYKKYRRPILEAGAELYEFRHDPSAEVRAIADVAPVRAEFISLHAKALVADRNQLFIGSLNLDPRAVEINTENGIYMESVPLASDLTQHFELLLSSDNAWRVSVDGEGRLQWTSRGEVVTSQPARNFGQRISDFFLRLLPIESQL